MVARCRAKNLIRSVRNFRLYGAFARERRTEEDGHDAYVHDKDPFAGGNGRTFDSLRSFCSAERPGRQARRTGARDFTTVVLLRPAQDQKPDGRGEASTAHFAVRLNYLPPRLLFVGVGKKWSRAVDKTVARLNIEHYRRLLATETDETRRRMLLQLLAEEEAKLKSGSAPEKKLRRN